MSKRDLLLGDEAVALGAIHAGISGAFSYPGTPATEIFEYVESIAAEHGVSAHWSANEKVAYEEALGMSFVGRRALVSMKHVGLNVAADAFMNSAVTGAHGGLVLCMADDPGMHSSQNEQDSRYFAHFALIPCIEPVNQQEAYDATRLAFDLSEKHGIPVMVRIVTRLAHSRSDVVTGDKLPQKPLDKTQRRGAFTLLPTNARVQYQLLTDKQPALQAESEASPYNILDLSAPDSRRGILVNGIAFNYLREVFGGTVPHKFVKVGMYPLPVQKIRKLVEAVDEVVVVEEGYPFMEEALRGVMGAAGKTIRGKLDGFLPRTGELNPGVVAAAFGIPVEAPFAPTLDPVPARPPSLCPGCSHVDTFLALNDALAGQAQSTVFSDIGCYTLGFYPPYSAIESCVDMGASVSMALGAARAGFKPVLCAVGDSTFCHGGMTGLLTAAHINAAMTVLILDNGTVAMTGSQETMATGEALDRIVLGLGVHPDHFKVVTPLPAKRKEITDIIRKELEYEGLSVIITRRPCIHLRRKA